MGDVDFSVLTDEEVLGLTGAGEARSHFVPGSGWQPAPMGDMEAVMSTVINRVRVNPDRYGATVKDACFEHDQYSCWNAKSGTNHDWLMSQAAALVNGTAVAPIVLRCIVAATRLMARELPDATLGSTHYYSPISMVPPGRVPLWARGKIPSAIIGDHYFFSGV